MQGFPWGKWMLWEVKKSSSHFERILNKGVAYQDARIPEVFSHTGTDSSHKEDEVHQRSLCRRIQRTNKIMFWKKILLYSGCRMWLKENQADQFLFKFMTTNPKVSLGLLESRNHISLSPFTSLLFIFSPLSSNLQHLTHSQKMAFAVDSARLYPDSLLLLYIFYSDNSQIQNFNLDP